MGYSCVSSTLGKSWVSSGKISLAYMMSKVIEPETGAKLFSEGYNVQNFGKPVVAEFKH